MEVRRGALTSPSFSSSLQAHAPPPHAPPRPVGGGLTSRPNIVCQRSLPARRARHVIGQQMELLAGPPAPRSNKRRSGLKRSHVREAPRRRRRHRLTARERLRGGAAGEARLDPEGRSSAQRPIVEAVLGGGAKQPSPRQALPGTINLAVRSHANGGVIEGNGAGCDQFGIAYPRAQSRRANYRRRLDSAQAAPEAGTKTAVGETKSEGGHLARRSTAGTLARDKYQPGVVSIATRRHGRRLVFSGGRRLTGVSR